MSEKKLHPTVEEFKDFVKQHPLLIREVRKGEHTWQELFEDWYLLGSDDPRWQSYQRDEKKTDKTSSTGSPNWLSQIGKALKKIDGKQMETHIQNLNEAIGAIQGVLAQFQQTQQNNQNNEMRERNPPFSFRKD